MIFPDAKKMSKVVVGRLDSLNSNHTEKREQAYGERAVLKEFASDMLQAIKDGSPQRLADCLESFFQELESLDEHEEDESEEF